MQNSTQAANAWRILFLLFLANLFNFFDRTIPAIIIEPIRMEWHLSDFQLGIIGTAFTLVYAIAGLPLGRMADTGSRSKLMGWGLAVERVDGGQRHGRQFWSFLLVRMGIGIGEASYAPAANSLIGDLFPGSPTGAGHGYFHARPAFGPVAGVLYHRGDGQGVRQLACTFLHRCGTGTDPGGVHVFHQGAEAGGCRERTGLPRAH
jgi:MFS family permease